MSAGRNRLRLAAVMSGASAAMHLSASAGHLREWWVFAVLFAVTAGLQLVWAARVWRRPSLPVLFWGPPIFYDLAMAPDFLRPALMANPVSPFIAATRAAILQAHGPSWVDLGLMAFWIAVAAIGGVWAFTRYAPRFAEEN